MWIARPSTASDASITASLSVGCGWMFRPISQASPWNSRLGDQLGRVGAHDVRAQDLARLAVCNHLDETGRLAVDDGAAERREWKLSDLHFVSFLFRLLLSQTDGG